MATSSTSQPLPRAWIDRLFLRLEGHYGDAFARKWAGVEDAAQREWARGLAGFTAEEIKHGLDNLGEWPPSLPEFTRLCRPSLNAERSFYEALRQIRLRQQNGSDRWSHPIVFWAAVWMGEDLFSAPYQRLATRWAEALDTTARDIEAGHIPATIPPKQKELPAPEPKTGNWMMRELCTQTVTTCLTGLACPCRNPLDDLPWLKGPGSEDSVPRIKQDGTYAATTRDTGKIIASIIERANTTTTRKKAA